VTAAPQLIREPPIDLDYFFSHLQDVREKNLLTHALHPYPAKFIPHIPRVLIEAFAPPGGIVLDPMCGSGTALVEAAISGRSAVGIDLNPVATLIARAKTTALTDRQICELGQLADLLHRTSTLIAGGEGEVLARLAEAQPPHFPNRQLWFDDIVAQELALILGLITERTVLELRNVALCAFSSTLVSLSNQESETRWSARPRVVRPGQASARVADRLRIFADALTRYAALRPAPVEVCQRDARATLLPSESIDFVVTSPPYANSHDYYLYHKLRMFWLGYEVRSVQTNEIGSRNRHSDLKLDIDVYVDEMRGVLTEVRRILKRSGHASIVVADAVIRGQLFNMGEIYAALGDEAGLNAVHTTSFDHRRFNSLFARGFGTRHKKMTHVLTFRKP